MKALKVILLFVLSLAAASAAFAQKATQRQAYVFGYAKNAMLVSSGQAPHEMGSHVGWAMGQTLPTLRSEWQRMTAITEKNLPGISGNRLAHVFAWQKNAVLVDGGQNPHDHNGHVGWANSQPPNVVRGEIVRMIRSGYRSF